MSHPLLNDLATLLYDLLDHLEKVSNATDVHDSIKCAVGPLDLLTEAVAELVDQTNKPRIVTRLAMRRLEDAICLMDLQKIVAALTVCYAQQGHYRWNLAPAPEGPAKGGPRS